jgi:hypothetical protein
LRRNADNCLPVSAGKTVRPALDDVPCLQKLHGGLIIGAEIARPVR